MLTKGAYAYVPHLSVGFFGFLSPSKGYKNTKFEILSL